MVGVVGIGHVDGITENWDKEIDVKELLRYSARLFCLVWSSLLVHLSDLLDCFLVVYQFAKYS